MAATQGCARHSAMFSFATAVTRCRHGCPPVPVRGIRA